MKKENHKIVQFQEIKKTSRKEIKKRYLYPFSYFYFLRGEYT